MHQRKPRQKFIYPANFNNKKRQAKMKTFLLRQVLSKKGVGKFTENFLRKTSFIKQLSLEKRLGREKSWQAN